MNNQEIDSLIERHDSALKRGAALAPASMWFGSIAFSVVALLSLSIAWAMFVFGVLASASLFSTFETIKEIKKRRSNGARLIWEKLGDNHVFGNKLSLPTRQLGTNIQKIYQLDPSGQILPLRQAIRLLDTFARQQQRSQLLETRLSELDELRQTLIGKLAQLHELGEDHPESSRNLQQITDDYDGLKGIHDQIRSSCHRLELILIAVQKAVQSRRLHRELDDLNARLPRSTAAVEPAFEAESLTDIERQIGREIETFLQLERETEAHLQ